MGDRGPECKFKSLFGCSLLMFNHFIYGTECNSLDFENKENFPFEALTGDSKEPFLSF